MGGDCADCLTCNSTCGAASGFEPLLDKPPHLEGFAVRHFTACGSTRLVYTRGTGPGIVFIHELPGFTPQVAALARRLADAGFAVECPILFGEVGRPFSVGYIAREAMRGCVRKEFAALAGNVTAPVTDYLRALATDLHRRVGGAGVGAIGMCFTARYALGMMLEPSVTSAVLSQPGNPIALTARGQAQLGLSPADAEALRARAVAGSCAALALRFTEDFTVRPERFAALKALLGEEHIVCIEIDSRKGNPHGISSGAHTVLTNDFVDKPGHPTLDALHRVLDFFKTRLGTGGGGGGMGAGPAATEPPGVVRA